MRSLSPFQFSRIVSTREPNSYFNSETEIVIPLGSDQPVYLVWKALEEEYLVKSLVHAHHVVSGAW